MTYILYVIPQRSQISIRQSRPKLKGSVSNEHRVKLGSLCTISVQTPSLLRRRACERGMSGSFESVQRNRDRDAEASVSPTSGFYRRVCFAVTAVGRGLSIESISSSSCSKSRTCLEGCNFVNLNVFILPHIKAIVNHEDWNWTCVVEVSVKP